MNVIIVLVFPLNHPSFVPKNMQIPDLRERDSTPYFSVPSTIPSLPTALQFLITFVIAAIPRVPILAHPAVIAIMPILLARIEAIMLPAITLVRIAPVIVAVSVSAVIMVPTTSVVAVLAAMLAMVVTRTIVALVLLVVIVDQIPVQVAIWAGAMVASMMR